MFGLVEIGLGGAGMAGLVEVCSGMERQGLAGKVRFGAARHGEFRQGMAGGVRFCEVRYGAFRRVALW